MRLLLETPPGYRQERRYIASLMLGEWLGLDFDLREADRADVALKGPDGRELVMPDCLFRTPEDEWLRPASMPRQPLRRWTLPPELEGARLPHPELPVVYGQDPARPGFLDLAGPSARLGVDVLGSCFLLLTRYEEVARAERDAIDRFASGSSLAQQEGFLGRALVNEYLELLWACLTRLWPGLERRERAYRLKLTCDLDWPFATVGVDRRMILRNLMGDVLKRRNPGLAWARVSGMLRARVLKDYSRDPHNTFTFMMDLGERAGVKGAFYFIADHSAGAVDGVYSLEEPWIAEIMKGIAARGHEIGLHPSFNSYRDPARIRAEFRKLVEAAEGLGIRQDHWGGRQHYLRWEAPVTWQAWEDAGLSYDSTLAYADQPGFRASCCYEYPAFNLHTRRTLKLREAPLVVMEETLLGETYLNLPHRQAFAEVEKLVRQVRFFKGDFVLLWHNSSLLTREVKQLFSEVVDLAR